MIEPLPLQAGEAPTAATADTKPEPLVRNRRFLLLLASYSITTFGNTFYSIALNLWILRTTGSAAAMAGFTIASLLISFALGSVAGTTADRRNRRSVMLAADLASALLVLTAALLLALPETVPLPFFLILHGLITVSGLFQSPAYQASVSVIVGPSRIQQAVGLLNLSENLCRTVGFAAGGILIAAIGASGAVLIDGLAFLLSYLLVLLTGSLQPKPWASPLPRTGQRQTAEADEALAERQTAAGAESSAVKMAAADEAAADKEAPPEPGVRRSFAGDLREGFRFAWEHPFARAVMVILPLLTLFFMPSMMLTQVMAVQVWQASSAQFGLMEASIPLGYMAGSAVIVFFGSSLRHRGRLIMAGLLALGPAYMLLSRCTSALSAIPVILLIGFLFAFATLLVQIILRLEVPPELQGRVFGVLGSVLGIAPSAGLTVVSVLSDRWSPQPVMAVLGGLLLLFALAAQAACPAVRRYR
ncbi:MFS transporter [Paenibacillus glufosinatiresistens]|uniref:MFS transporter n=1 Tax=Paenibacillus glufosinatiresistens TaxID=3070657 RepID=UPI00286E9985|nr:MFS transporter [Paenibacillus sp. YX.27]